MKHLFWVFVAIYSSLILVACNKNSAGGDAVPVLPGCYSMSPTGQCMNQYGVVIPSVNSTLAYFADNWSNQRTVSISDPTTYKEFLRTAMGVCDRYENSGGAASCNDWVNGGFDIVIEPTPDNLSARLTVRAWPQYNMSYNYAYSFPSWQGMALSFLGVPPAMNAGVYRNPMVLMPNQPIAPVNASAGFEIRYNGPAGSFSNRNQIQVRVDQGHLGDNTFNFKLYFPNCVSTGGAGATCTNGYGTEFARGTFTRCVTPGCSGGMF